MLLFVNGNALEMDVMMLKGLLLIQGRDPLITISMFEHKREQSSVCVNIIVTFIFRQKTARLFPFCFGNFKLNFSF